jgi:hypothetical protein
MDNFYNFIGGLLLLTLPASWLTHIIVCLVQGKYLLLIAGAFVFPVGMIHGYGIWLGVDW